MSIDTIHCSAVSLSICITTFNRARYIGATLASIISQLPINCEVVVVDGASTDNTEDVVTEYTKRCDRLHYIKQSSNNGIDRDYDRTVELSSGEYCWLMSDDDHLKSGSVETVQRALRAAPSLLIINSEFRSSDMGRVLKSRWLDISSDRTYGPDQLDHLFSDVGRMLVYIGAVVIRRSVWLARHRASYYGSMFIHVGVIFQAPLPGDTQLIADPLISNRIGNAHTFSPKMFETLMVRWPSVVWSLALADSTKSKVSSREPWRNPTSLFWSRGMGFYTKRDYSQWIQPKLPSIYERLLASIIVRIPGPLINALCIAHIHIFKSAHSAVALEFLKTSPFYFGSLRAYRREPDGCFSVARARCFDNDR